MKFGIGSVQFGTPYGISNTSGQSTTKEVSSIIELLNKLVFI